MLVKFAVGTHLFHGLSLSLSIALLRWHSVETCEDNTNHASLTIFVQRVCFGFYLKCGIEWKRESKMLTYISMKPSIYCLLNICKFYLIHSFILNGCVSMLRDTLNKLEYHFMSLMSWCLLIQNTEINEPFHWYCCRSNLLHSSNAIYIMEVSMNFIFRPIFQQDKFGMA